MGFAIFITVMLFWMASVVGCFPDKQKTARKLSIAACVMMAVTLVSGVIIKDGMFSDFAALPHGMMSKAVITVVTAAAAAVGMLLVITDANDKKK